MKNIEKKTKIKAGGENHVVYKDKDGSIMTTHPGKDKGKYDTIDLTTKAGATTLNQGVEDVKKWHKNHPRLKGLASPETVKKMFKKK